MSLEIIYGPLAAQKQKLLETHRLARTLSAPGQETILVPSINLKHQLIELFLEQAPLGFFHPAITTQEPFIERLCNYFEIPTRNFSPPFIRHLIKTLLHFVDKNHLLQVFSAVKDKKGIHLQIMQLIQRLENNLLIAAEFGRSVAENPLLQDVTIIYQHYTAFIQSILDDPNHRNKTTSLLKYQMLIQRIEEAQSEPLPTLPPQLIIFGFMRIPPNLLALLNALARETPIVIFLPPTTRLHPDLNRAIDTLKGIHFNQFQETHLTNPNQPSPPPSAPVITTIQTPTIQHEISFIAHKIKMLHRQDPSLLAEDFAILSPDPAADYPLIARTLAELHIPLHFQPQLATIDHPFIQFLLNWLTDVVQYHHQNFNPTLLFQLLDAPYFPAFAQLANIDAILDLRTTGQFSRIMAALGSDLQIPELWARLEKLKHPSQLKKAPFDLEALTRCEAWLRTLYGFYEKSFNPEMAINTFIPALHNMALELSTFLLPSTPMFPAADIIMQGFLGVNQMADELFIHLYPGELSLNQCVSLFKEMIVQVTAPTRPTKPAPGVHLLPHQATILQPYQFGFYLKCQEGQLPKHSTTTLLDDTQLLKINQMLGCSLLTSLDHLALSTSVLQNQIADGFTRGVFFLQSDYDLSGRLLAPSPLLAFTGSEKKIDWFDPASRFFPDARFPNWSALVTHLQQQNTVKQNAPLFDSPPGDITKIVGNNLSASTLERYARCPYLVLAEKRYHLSDFRPFQRDQLITGELIHFLLERLFTLPLANAIILSGQIDEAALGHFIETTLTPVIQFCLWDSKFERALLFEQMLPFVRTVLDLEIKAYQTTGVAWTFRPEVPLQGQLHFDFDHHRVTFLAPNQAVPPHPADQPPPRNQLILPFRGKIDRIDSDPQRNCFMVIDYKLGAGNKTPIGKNSYSQGQRFQMTLYLTGYNAWASPTTPNKKPQGVAGFYLFLADASKAYGLFLDDYNQIYFNHSRRLSSCVKSAEEWATIMEENEHHFVTYVGKMRQGLFAPQPSKPSHCVTCQFSWLCQFQTDVQDEADG